MDNACPGEPAFGSVSSFGFQSLQECLGPHIAQKQFTGTRVGSLKSKAVNSNQRPLASLSTYYEECRPWSYEIWPWKRGGSDNVLSVRACRAVL
jgi:hypothetical protein